MCCVIDQHQIIIGYDRATNANYIPSSRISYDSEPMQIDFISNSDVLGQAVQNVNDFLRISDYEFIS